MTIEKGNYEGYLWMSDDTNPKMIDGEFEMTKDDNENPFIVEGFLYESSKHLSISIKYVDGQYICNRYVVDKADFTSDCVDKKSFIGNRMNGKRLSFLQYWDDKPDALCENMTVQVPSKLVFVGFNDGE